MNDSDKTRTKGETVEERGGEQSCMNDSDKDEWVTRLHADSDETLRSIMQTECQWSSVGEVPNRCGEV